MPADRQDAYQQFFFVVRDDVDQVVEDYFIDFYVATREPNAPADRPSSGRIRN